MLEMILIQETGRAKIREKKFVIYKKNRNKGQKSSANRSA